MGPAGKVEPDITSIRQPGSVGDEACPEGTYVESLAAVSGLGWRSRSRRGGDDQPPVPGWFPVPVADEAVIAGGASDRHARISRLVSEASSPSPDQEKDRRGAGFTLRIGCLGGLGHIALRLPSSTASASQSYSEIASINGPGSLCAGGWCCRSLTRRLDGTTCDESIDVRTRCLSSRS